eukprot:2089398-Amphidinium_carterae.1
MMNLHFCGDSGTVVLQHAYKANTTLCYERSIAPWEAWDSSQAKRICLYPLRAQIVSILGDRFLSAQEAVSLREHVSFLACNTFGHNARAALVSLQRFSSADTGEGDSDWSQAWLALRRYHGFTGCALVHQTLALLPYRSRRCWANHEM